MRGRSIWPGQVADSPVPAFRSPTEQILAAIDRLFAEAATDKSKILFVIVLLTDIKRFDQMNEGETRGPRRARRACDR